MGEVVTSRPFMPGYGIVGPDEGGGLLPWSWAERRLTESRNYWVGTRWPEGRPHLMPVWAVWADGELWFSSALRSRKIRNLVEHPEVTVATENPVEPVIVEGTAHVVTDRSRIRRFLDAMNAKYETSYAEDFLDPALNASVVVRPRRVIGLDEANFVGTPTRWVLQETAGTIQ